MNVEDGKKDRRLYFDLRDHHKLNGWFDAREFKFIKLLSSMLIVLDHFKKSRSTQIFYAILIFIAKIMIKTLLYTQNIKESFSWWQVEDNGGGLFIRTAFWFPQKPTTICLCLYLDNLRMGPIHIGFTKKGRRLSNIFCYCPLIKAQAFGQACL